MRICYPFPLRYVGHKVVDGRDTFTFPGPEGAYASTMYYIMLPLFPNATHQFDEHMMCLKKIIENTTDLIYVERSWPSSEKGHVEVPVITGSSNIKLINLLKRDQITWEPAPAVMENFHSLTPSVYWCSVALTLFMITVVVTKVVSNHLLSRVNRVNETSSSTVGGIDPDEETKKANIILSLMRVILNHLHSLFYYSDDEFKLICLVYSLLAFSMIVSISSVFTTNQLIINKPPVITNYRELIEHPTSSPFFFLSRSFGDTCDAHDVECQMVQKYPRMKRHINVTWPGKDSFASIFDNFDVVIVDSSVEVTFRQALCFNCMAEFPVIRILDSYTQWSRGEELLGFPVSLSIITKSLIGRLKRIVESGLFSRREMERLVIASGVFKPLAPNVTYFNEQRRACAPDYVPEYTDPQLKPLSPGHIASLVKLMVMVWAVTGIVLAIEMIIGLTSMH